MAVAPTGAIYKALEFDGVSSRTYGVYITGAAVYNAPQRDVEMIAIPGRNGSFALDKGRFENIEVSYPAGIFADAESDFAEAVSDFRNFLCSRNGYVRLQDEYNPNEYRLAVYKSGLEVEPALLRAGEFEIVFECKPQRYLTSGETAVTVTSGDTITNPTLFEASPKLQVYGYGGIDINNDVISVDNIPLGTIQLAAASSEYGQSYSKTIEGNLLNINDDFTFGATLECIYNGTNPTRFKADIVGTITVSNCVVDTQYNNSLILLIDNTTFIKGTASSLNYSVSFSVKITNIFNGTSVTTPLTVSCVLAYDGDSTITNTITPSTTISNCTQQYKTSIPDIFADSTRSALGNPLYIDLDIGEAYNTDYGSPVSANNAVSIPTVLPKFIPGANTITFDNTFTKIEVVPRWWKV